MPVILQYISFIIGILSFIITGATFIVAWHVNRKILRLHESEKFHINRQEIIDKLDGYIRSIQNDYLYKYDSETTLQPDILVHLKDIATKYTHLSRMTKKLITDAENYLKCPSIDWLKVAETLVSLKNYIEKEI